MSEHSKVSPMLLNEMELNVEKSKYMIEPFVLYDICVTENSNLK
jgi:hypothetical protein